ncbi:sulfite exporter TauE/SafE family protein [Shimia sp. SDUM112013]|uniref:sulfite exporter TauE/SafE family protein n=1 Tax=Shimia sp. SDUM112013 TaxID=3136160 RepID=UPI0032EB7483
MNSLFTLVTPDLFGAALLIAGLAGIIKGMVGFAMPMVMISGLSTFLPPDLALAGLIVPTLVTNGMQALRQGVGAALISVRKFRVFLLAGVVSLLISAQFVRIIPPETMLLLIGGPVALFAVIQLMGVRVSLPERSARIEAGVGGFAGLIGGFSGVWGPPTVLYLTALNTEKTEQMRVQGVIYGLGAVALFFAHIGSGVVRAETLPFSLAMVPPAVLGMWLGGKVQDRIDQTMFKKATLVVLTLAALNLVRRALVG